VRGNAVGIHQQFAGLALADMPAEVDGLLEGKSQRAGVALDHGGRPRHHDIDALVRDAVMTQRAGNVARGVLRAPRPVPRANALLQVGDNLVGDALAANKENRKAVALPAGGEFAASRQGWKPVGRRRSCGSVHDSPMPKADARPREGKFNRAFCFMIAADSAATFGMGRERLMIQKNIGACFEIIVDGKPRSMRDLKETAIEAGIYLKRKQPESEVSVRDVRDNSSTVIDGKNIVAFDLAAARKR
jgi:hypothetical protein